MNQSPAPPVFIQIEAIDADASVRTIHMLSQVMDLALRPDGIPFLTDSRLSPSQLAAVSSWFQQRYGVAADSQQPTSDPQEG
jgi:hypothetical protein